MADFFDGLAAAKTAGPQISPAITMDDKGNIVITITPEELKQAKSFKAGGSTGFGVDASFKAPNGNVIGVSTRWLGFKRIA